MATMYCALCARPVEASRRIGLGTVVLAVLTVGISLLAIPFYRKRCAICQSTAVTLLPPGDAADYAGSATPGRLDELEHRLRLVEDELELAGSELRQLKTEQDFYRQLLGNPNSPGKERST